MNMLTPAELTESYAKLGKTKAEKPFGKLIILAVFAGILIGSGAATCNTAVHAIENAGIAKLISGLVFPFGLGVVMLLGAELFTSNVMIGISVLNGDTTVKRMLRNWAIVYFGNFLGGVILAFTCARFGQLDYSHGYLAVYTIKIAAAKTAMPFANALVSGIWCNVLVCAAVLCSLSAKDTAGRILGAYLAIAFFVICGYEHCVANMYYIPAGLFALQVPAYASLAAEKGLDVSALTWGNFFLHNLLPVTIGNILGGSAVGIAMWATHVKGKVHAPVAANTAETPVSGR